MSQCGAHASQSAVLDAGVAVLINGAGHREEDRNYVLSLAGNVQGTVMMADKGGTFSAGELRFEGVPEDLVKKYFKASEISKKSLKFR